MRNDILRKGLVFGILLLFVTASIVSALNANSFSYSPSAKLGNWLYVGGSGPGNYSTIQSAINNASDGDTVFVYDDSSPYLGNITVDKSITLIGENRDTTVITGVDDYIFSKEKGIMIHSSNITISNMTIKDYQGLTIGAGVEITDASIRNVILKNLNLINNCFGIMLCNHSFYIRDIVLTNIFLYNNLYGVRLIKTTECSVSDCIFDSNVLGLVLDGSYNDIIQNNTFHHDGGLGMWGNYFLKYYVHIVKDNIVNGKPLLYFINKTSLVLDNVKVGQIILVNCSDAHIQNLTLNDSVFGIYTAFSDNTTIRNCSFNKASICLDQSERSTIISNEFNGNYHSDSIGILLSNNNSVISNEINNNDYIAIHIYSSNDNIIKSNKIFNNKLGINIVSSSNHNMIYHNNLNNTQNAVDECNNIWDDGEKGNYWEDYKEKYPDAHKVYFKGIWNTPYNIPNGANKDRYPLVKQWPSVSSISTMKFKILNFNRILFQRFPHAFPILRHLLGY